MFSSVVPIALLLSLTPQLSLIERPAIEESQPAPAGVLTETSFGLPAVTFARSTLPRWQQVAGRYQSQMSGGSPSWDRLVTRLRQVDATEILQRVNAEVNRARYISDARNWRASDYWATPQELLARGGDCEDYAIAKYLLLRELGVDPRRMHVAVGMGHAYLVVMTDSAGAVVLDNQFQHLRPLSPNDLASIVFTMNELGWSVNVGRGEPRQRFAAAFQGVAAQP